MWWEQGLLARLNCAATRCGGVSACITGIFRVHISLLLVRRWLWSLLPVVPVFRLMVLVSRVMIPSTSLFASRASKCTPLISVPGRLRCQLRCLRSLHFPIALSCPYQPLRCLIIIRIFNIAIFELSNPSFDSRLALAENTVVRLAWMFFFAGNTFSWIEAVDGSDGHWYGIPTLGLIALHRQLCSVIATLLLLCLTDTGYFIYVTYHSTQGYVMWWFIPSGSSSWNLISHLFWLANLSEIGKTELLSTMATAVLGLDQNHILDYSLGALEIGAFIDLVLYGITTVQVYMYYAWVLTIVRSPWLSSNLAGFLDTTSPMTPFASASWYLFFGRPISIY